MTLPDRAIALTVPFGTQLGAACVEYAADAGVNHPTPSTRPIPSSIAPSRVRMDIRKKPHSPLPQPLLQRRGRKTCRRSLSSLDVSTSGPLVLRDDGPSAPPTWTAAALALA